MVKLSPFSFLKPICGLKNAQNFAGGLQPRDAALNTAPMGLRSAAGQCRPRVFLADVEAVAGSAICAVFVIRHGIRSEIGCRDLHGRHPIDHTRCWRVLASAGDPQPVLSKLASAVRPREVRSSGRRIEACLAELGAPVTVVVVWVHAAVHADVARHWL